IGNARNEEPWGALAYGAGVELTFRQHERLFGAALQIAQAVEIPKLQRPALRLDAPLPVDFSPDLAIPQIAPVPIFEYPLAAAEARAELGRPLDIQLSRLERLRFWHVQHLISYPRKMHGHSLRSGSIATAGRDHRCSGGSSASCGC